MLNGIKRLFKGQPLETVTELMTRGALCNYDRNDHEMGYEHSIPYQDHHPRMLSQQLIDNLAKLRENTTIICRDPSEEARSRLMRPIFEPGASLPWPPIYPPAPLKYDFYADRYTEESSSPPSSFISEPSDLGNCNERVSVAESPVLLRDPTHPQRYSDSSPRFDHGLSVFHPKAPSPTQRIIPHIIGEDDPFNPFSYDLFFEDDNARSIDTPKGKIFAPVPKLPITAALANFEVIALATMAPAAEGVLEKEPFQNKDDGMLSDDTTSGSVSGKGVAPPLREHSPALVVANIQQPSAEHGDVLYETGPHPQVKLVDDMVALLSLKQGPLKDEKMKQLWNGNGQGALGSSCGKPTSEMTGNEVYEALVPVPPQPPTSYSTGRQQLSHLRVLSKDH